MILSRWLSDLRPERDHEQHQRERHHELGEARETQTSTKPPRKPPIIPMINADRHRESGAADRDLERRAPALEQPQQLVASEVPSAPAKNHVLPVPFGGATRLVAALVGGLLRGRADLRQRVDRLAVDRIGCVRERRRRSCGRAIAERIGGPTVIAAIKEHRGERAREQHACRRAASRHILAQRLTGESPSR